ncbi:MULTISPECIES: molybdopterin molybdotransferase MoeA [unclassified Gordonia (in: high G+C Gram-positive bacteria)]|uniref:molybdopterin molybdotransferase MoeA n=1 Tax=unclassified Gordonia (in: high G+C Gram-positive bacteria) TaxID=2657482 RepID=UPI0007EA2A92|nr:MULTISPECIES: gephyrin-like molybdotransferase Glp [unclassified Gordonia (in: high G+C Gram-positive bacteria)]OBB99623.1 molybdopterin molybdenumtransferase [Gordonia sp. 852002-50395_SCH5434458]OBC13904.1 molybdopterin molybdenumtransferase [Gordonia sp. 852002-50816_SCH5313054-c]OBC16212.1 molybdopterin molybdenumtransferase [Gordonia sp. 852002-50816_SCH5313054-a]
MRSVAEHQKIVSELFGPPETVRVAVADALGMATVDDAVAAFAMPAFDNSAMDGYAVRADDIAGASAAEPVRLPVVDDIPAGRTGLVTLAPGTTARIMTGAPLPDGADAVVPVELTDGDFSVDHVPDSTVGFSSGVEAGKHIRREGSDIARGDVALPAGTVLRAAQIGLLSALGLADVAVARRLRVVVLSTGSELVEPGKSLQHGQIYESNGAMLTAALTEAGALARHVHFVPDDVADFLERLDEASADADLIITSGGVSAGAYEVVKEALDAGPVEFVKVAMQPGMPQGCGHHLNPAGRRVPIITLPGNPVSSLVSFEVFIRPPLRAAMGLSPDRPRVAATLGSDIRSPEGKRQFMRGVVDESLLPGVDGQLVVEPIGPPGSHHLRYLAGANALIDIPAATTALPAGSVVDVVVL